MCINRLVLECSDYVYNKFSKNFKLSKVRREPKNLDEDDLINWRYEHWGTIEEIKNTKITVCDSLLIIEFISTDAPPIEALDYLAAKYTDINISLDYIDIGMSIYGDAKWEKGNQIYNTTYGFENIDEIDEKVKKLWNFDNFEIKFDSPEDNQIVEGKDFMKIKMNTINE